MKKVYLVGGILVVVVAVAIGVSNFYSNTKKLGNNYGLEDNKSQTVATSTDSSSKTVDSVATYSLAQVATHKDASSCWTVVGDGVYDLTAFIDQHPGGPDKILRLCGKDGTEAFTNKHGGQMRPENELASLMIGKLAK